MQKNHIGPLMKKISEEAERKINEEIKKYQLTFTQARVIIFLSEFHDQNVTQKELEDFLQVSHPTTVSIVKSMEKKGMLKTSFDEKDRRMKNIHLTWGSEEIYKKLFNQSNKMEALMVKDLSEEDQKQFRVLLEKVYKNIVS